MKPGAQKAAAVQPGDLQPTAGQPTAPTESSSVVAPNGSQSRIGDPPADDDERSVLLLALGFLGKRSIPDGQDYPTPASVNDKGRSRKKRQFFQKFESGAKLTNLECASGKCEVVGTNVGPVGSVADIRTVPYTGSDVRSSVNSDPSATKAACSCSRNGKQFYQYFEGTGGGGSLVCSNGVCNCFCQSATAAASAVAATSTFVTSSTSQTNYATNPYNYFHNFPAIFSAFNYWPFTPVINSNQAVANSWPVYIASTSKPLMYQQFGAGSPPVVNIGRKKRDAQFHQTFLAGSNSQHFNCATSGSCNVQGQQQIIGGSVTNVGGNFNQNYLGGSSSVNVAGGGRPPRPGRPNRPQRPTHQG